MEAVHFGAGNIGRGFIGALLNQANYHTTFVDVNDTVIKEINNKQQYDVILADEKQEKLTVNHIAGINSVTNPEAVVDAIVKADIITTAVGPNILAIISELIARGLRKRLEANPQPVNIIACENMVGGSSLLKEKVYEHLSQDEQAAFSERFAFPNAAVDRIVPNQTNEDLLTVSVEPYFEWVVEKSAMKGTIPDIPGITYVDDLKPYIERKLFTVNTGHTVPAYIGHFLGYETINDAMKDEHVQSVIAGALHESGEALIRTYGFERSKHEAYVEKIIQRFKNPYISDEVTRVGRGPIRKLGPDDRLIRPAKMFMETTDKEPENLGKVIAAVLRYVNPADEEAVKLQEMIADKGIEKTLQDVSKLAAGDPLISVILREKEELENLRK
ncbi:mannitol-1-phosphate 5-dehydrogenase [Virgibacillus sp. 179-BFC.A HS]|uniref:Mannitol-1-phosphate 5-dehydrogenase n=1 Tax=Tigheibacillus jepli TaxID=3035914 RepID=A0ABU5CJW7_9BACI|nr:mannitol-1-phosphate 5-dehydrogenase [Virgibacillus sp. 179-BFC.A HS]MDY0406137.1 mannitol-1-phosphate 5-dehydrogenase [Virgibacillus sp. 179-BFC.A HS]